MNDKDLYAQILDISSPWSVDSVKLPLESNSVTVTLDFDQSYPFTCPECSTDCPRYDKKPRRWRHLDTCQLDTVIECQVPRIKCKEHGVKMVNIPWAEKGSHFTLLFEALVIKWLEVAPVSAVSARMRIDWDSALRIQHRAVESGLSRRGSVTPVDVAIDETGEKKGHNYLTVVSEGGCVLCVEAGRDKDSIDVFWKTLSDVARVGIRSVSMDLWSAYRSSTIEYVPDAEAKICLDRFHVAGYFGKAVNDVRKKEHRTRMAEGDESLKGSRYDWLRTRAVIGNRSRRCFMEIGNSALKTSRAWALKVIAHGLWNYVYIGVAEKKWEHLLSRMMRSRLEPMKRLAKSLRRHLWMIINAIKLKANSGNAESNNSRIQKVKKMACGFRNTENFKMAVYFHQGGLDLTPEFPTTH